MTKACSIQLFCFLNLILFLLTNINLSIKIKVDQDSGIECKLSHMWGVLSSYFLVIKIHNFSIFYRLLLCRSFPFITDYTTNKMA